MDLDRFDRAIARFDEENAHDPRRVTVDGADVPAELVYARRMTDELTRLFPEAPEALRLAARAQHLRRFDVPRSDYPAGNKGYHRWRIHLMQRQAALAAEILAEVGYGAETVERVERLIEKREIAKNPEAQALEDVACLVFLRHYFADFAAKHGEDDLVRILKKTWVKMSERGHAAARAIALDVRESELLARALES